MKTVTIIVEAGTATVASKPKDVKVVVRDYDVADDSDDRVKLDRDGKPHYQEVYK